MALLPEAKQEFEAQGFTIVRGLFGAAEVEELKQHFMAINTARGAAQSCWASSSARRSGGCSS